jgi:glycosyltransferase involved in cell wall biosynthesis
MRILHVIATLDAASGGSAAACIEMADALARRGHQVDIMTTDFSATAPGQLPRHTQPLACRILTYPVTFPRAWKYSPALAHALAEHAQDYDLLVIHSLHLFHNLAAPRAARRAGRPYIVAPHGLLDPYIRSRSRLKKLPMDLLYQNRALREAAAVHYTSLEEKRISQPFVGDVPGITIPLGVALAAANPGERKASRILFLSRLHEKKGLDLLIPAFAKVKAKLPDAELVVAGPDDGALGSTRTLAARHGVAGSVSFPGMLQGTAKDAAFAEASLFVLPSYSENFGIALAEAMAAGVPVVTTDMVNIHDDVRAANAGLVVSCAVEPLAEAMGKILSNRELAAVMGRNGRRLAATRYNWDDIGAQWERACQEIITRHAAGA